MIFLFIVHNIVQKVLHNVVLHIGKHVVLRALNIDQKTYHKKQLVLVYSPFHNSLSYILYNYRILGRRQGILKRAMHKFVFSH